MDVYRVIGRYSVVFLLAVSLKNVVSTPVFQFSMARKLTSALYKDDYMQKRQHIISDEQDQRLGGEIVLNKDEQAVNDKLLKLKQTEIDNAHYQGKPFGPAMNFLKSKSVYEESQIFKLIQTMPKGGALHVHDCSISDIKWLVKNVTYRDNCYMCYDLKNEISFQFFQTPPVNKDCPWKPVDQYRQQSGNVSHFDDTLIKSMILTDEYADLDINTIWQRFEGILTRANGLINYKPVFSDYYYEALREFNEDNVQYVEVRALLPDVYELDGTTLNTLQVMQIYKDTTDRFLATNKNFTGAKIIKTNLRFKSPDDILDDIKNSIQLMQQFPDHFAGYDLVGQEDPGKTLLYYIDALRYPSLQSPPIKLPYFFHAGETDWQGTRVDDNLIDAVLLNTSRIGHGYALPKHPEVMKIVRQQDIAIEVNPISNQVLKLVDDMQNHPGSVLLAEGLPVVISSDDPAVWGAKGLSYDFYAAFMALSGKDDGLEVLKQLAMNSLIYSALEDKKKVQALKDWEEKWKTFIDKTVGQMNGSILIG